MSHRTIHVGKDLVWALVETVEGDEIYLYAKQTDNGWPLRIQMDNPKQYGPSNYAAVAWFGSKALAIKKMEEMILKGPI